MTNISDAQKTHSHTDTSDTHTATDSIISEHSTFHKQSEGVLIATPKEDVADVWYAHSDDRAIDIEFDSEHSLMNAFISAWQSLLKSIKHSYVTTADSFIDEVLIKLSRQQVNDALHQFVVKNVDMVNELYMDFHDDWLTLHATVSVKGVFAKVSCDFRLVQAIISADAQRFVFEQLSDVNIIELHTKQWWQAPAAKAGVGVYKTITRQDPLGLALSKITVKDLPFATYKGKFIYLDIHRYLAKQTKIINMLRKVQVNHGSTGIDKLLLKLQINFAEVLSFGDSGEDIITEKDNPDRQSDKA